jgi:hypothetical protein
MTDEFESAIKEKQQVLVQSVPSRVIASHSLARIGNTPHS